MQFSLFRSHFLYFLFFLCLFLGIPSCLGKPINRKRKLKSDNEAGKERITWTAVQINWKIRDYWTRLRSFLRFFYVFGGFLTMCPPPPCRWCMRVWACTGVVTGFDPRLVWPWLECYSSLSPSPQVKYNNTTKKCSQLYIVVPIHYVILVYTSVQKTKNTITANRVRTYHMDPRKTSSSKSEVFLEKT